MATLGSKPTAATSTKILSKNDIQNTEIPGVCQLIVEPEGPMALRLSSNLLYGVSLVFRHQVTYLLSKLIFFR